jgi:hypothetical protein
MHAHAHAHAFRGEGRSVAYYRRKSTRTCPVSQEWLHQGNVRWTAHVIQLGKRDKQTEFWKGSLSDGDNMEGQHEHCKMIQWIVLGHILLR